MVDKLAWSVITVSVLIGLSPFIADEVLLKKDTITFETKVNVTPSREVNGTYAQVGVDPGKNLDFGRLPADLALTKFVNVTAPNRTIITITESGNISDQLYINDTQFYFEGRRKVSMRLNATETGFYTGEVTINAERPRNKWGQRWLDIKYRFY
ncbi:MAG: hypothetical protein ABEI58_04185 [Candidatus Nanohaloarchaea archaeon]